LHKVSKHLMVCHPLTARQKTLAEIVLEDRR
jgi:hypothetical protein